MTRKQITGVILLIIIVSTVNIIFNINNFIYLKGSDYSDIAISHFPNLLFIQRSISQYHQIPLWSNLIFSGYPFAADPLSGLWYLFGWIPVLFPLPMGININIILHVLLTFVGLFLFLVEEGRSSPAAIFGAIVFSLSTRLFSHLAAGHLTLIYAVAWTPWLLLVTKKFSNSSMWYKKLLPGVIFGLIFTADPRWVFPAGLIWAFYLINIKCNFKSIFQIGILTGITGLVTSAGAWIPLLQFVPLTTRSLLTNQENLIYSLNFEKLIGFLMPEFGGFAEWVIYPGAITLLLFVMGIFLYKDNKQIRFWYGIAAVSLVLSMGNSVPFLNLLFSLPVFSLLRVPSRFILLLFLVFAVVCSYVVDYLVFQEKKYKFDRIFFITPILAFVLLLSAGIVIVTGNLTISMIWSIIFFIVSFTFIAIVYHKKDIPPFINFLFIAILLFELVGINFQSLKFKSPQEVLTVNEDLNNLLKVIPPFGRIYTPSYSLTQEQAANLGISQINGIDPMQLTDYVKYFSTASGIPINQYTVTLPPFSSGTPELDNTQFCPDKEYLQNLNVEFILSDFEFLNCDGFHVYTKFDNSFVYQLEGNYLLPNIYNNTRVNVFEYTPNRIILQTNGGGEIVLSEIYYPGWVVYVDGAKTILQSKGIFRSVTVSEGSHEIELIFRPSTVFLGLSIQFIGLMIFMVLLIRKK